MQWSNVFVQPFNDADWASLSAQLCKRHSTYNLHTEEEAVKEGNQRIILLQEKRLSFMSYQIKVDISSYDQRSNIGKICSCVSGTQLTICNLHTEEKED